MGGKGVVSTNVLRWYPAYLGTLRLMRSPASHPALPAC